MRYKLEDVLRIGVAKGIESGHSPKKFLAYFVLQETVVQPISPEVKIFGPSQNFRLASLVVLDQFFSTFFLDTRYAFIRINKHIFFLCSVFSCMQFSEKVAAEHRNCCISTKLRGSLGNCTMLEKHCPRHRIRNVL